ncbi:hypothetical protein KI387_036561, partial [Taxus chinensis]
MFFIGGRRERAEKFHHSFHTIHSRRSTRRLHYWSYISEKWAHSKDQTMPNQVLGFIGAKREATT